MVLRSETAKTARPRRLIREYARSSADLAWAVSADPPGGATSDAKPDLERTGRTGRLVVVSNRVPLPDKTGASSAGGLTGRPVA